MDAEEFRVRAKQLVDFIADYHLSHADRSPLASKRPLAQRIGPDFPTEAPQQPMLWDEVMQLFESNIMPGISHWQHPKFFSFFPHGHSFPSVCADLLSTSLGSVSFKNDISPIYGELEKLVMVWMTHMLGLPKCLEPGEEAGGIILGSAGEGMKLAIVAARNRVIADQGAVTFEDTLAISSRLVLFCSSEAHLTVRKAAEFFLMRLRIVPTSAEGVLDSEKLQTAIQEELASDRLPCLVAATVGTTSICQIDPIAQLGQVCQRHKCWFHVDAAYAGAALICPEYRSWLDGAETIDSLVINAHKWLLVHFDCSLFWIKDIRLLRISTQKVNALYGYGTSDFYLNKDPMFCHVPFGRRFRALKLWFVILTYGVEGLQQHIRKHIRLAKIFEAEILADDRLELATTRRAAVVCFRLKAGNGPTKSLEDLLRETRKVDIRSANFPGTSDVILRFAVCSPYATESHIREAAALIKGLASQALELPRRMSESNGQALKFAGRPLDFYSRTSESEGRTSESEGRTSESEGRTSESDGRTSESEGRTSESDGRTLDLYGRTPESDSLALKLQALTLELASLMQQSPSVKKVRQVPRSASLDCLSRLEL